VLKTHLNTAQIALFRRMSAAEQTHALAVLHTLQQDGFKVMSSPDRFRSGTDAGGSRDRHSAQAIDADPALAQAALLHDVGKIGERIRIWHRVATALLQALYPALLRHLALNEPRSWRYPFFVLLHHAEHGADLSAGAGTDAVAVALIRAHHTAPEQSGLDAPRQALLTALRCADEQN
jgi:AcrR family transcriptional regulator